MLTREILSLAAGVVLGAIMTVTRAMRYDDSSAIEMSQAMISSSRKTSAS